MCRNIVAECNNVAFWNRAKCQTFLLQIDGEYLGTKDFVYHQLEKLVKWAFGWGVVWPGKKIYNPPEANREHGFLAGDKIAFTKECFYYYVPGAYYHAIYTHVCGFLVQIRFGTSIAFNLKPFQA
jgi:hypothetical protein